MGYKKLHRIEFEVALPPSWSDNDVREWAAFNVGTRGCCSAHLADLELDEAIQDASLYIHELHGETVEDNGEMRGDSPSQSAG